MRKLHFIMLVVLLAPLMANSANIPSFKPQGNISGFNEPTRVAADSSGNIYVSDSLARTVKVYSSAGALLNTIDGVGKPLGIAETGGKVYIGDDSDGSVKVYDTGSSGFVTPLGNGAGEFNMPNAIAVSKSTGRIYVVDSNAHIRTDSSTGQTVVDSAASHVKIYNSDGSFWKSFGAYGTEDGQFQFPVDIAIDDDPAKGSGNVYIGDNTSGRIQYFDLDGVLRGKFGSSGMVASADSKIIRLSGLTVDSLGRVYAVDAFQSEVKVFTQTGDYLTKVGSFGKAASQLDHPIGAVVNTDDKLYIASSNSEKIEIFTINNLKVSSEALNFSATEGGSNPGAQDLVLSDVDHPVSWTASSAESWINMNLTQGTTPSTISVTVNIADKAASATAYSGSISIKDRDTGTVFANITVRLTVNESPVPITPVLNVSPTTVVFSGIAGGDAPTGKSVTVANTGGGTMNWSAGVTYDTAGLSWLTLDKSSGSGNTNINLSVNTAGLVKGDYNASVVISAVGAKSSPQGAMVILSLKDPTIIKVSSNLGEASYSVIGPESYMGSGADWTKSEAAAGQYTVTFDKIAGYITPLPQTKEVAAESTVSFSGTYIATKVLDSIIVGSGEQALIRVFDNKGGLNKSFSPYKSSDSVKVAAGDIDGDGAAEIISTLWDGPNNRAIIVVSQKDGVEKTSFMASRELRYGATVAAADIDGDGKAEIIVGGGPGAIVPGRVKIYKYHSGKIVDTGVNFLAFDGGYGVNVAGGDIDSDGRAEIVTAPGPNPGARGVVKVWEIDTTGGLGRWKAVLANSFEGLSSYYGATVAVADMDSDGKAEIVVGAGPGADNDAHVKVFKGNGNIFGVEFMAGNWRYGVNVAAGDILGEAGVSEILVSPGYGQRNSSLVRIFDSTGRFRYDFNAFETRYGASIAVGGLK